MIPTVLGTSLSDVIDQNFQFLYPEGDKYWLFIPLNVKIFQQITILDTICFIIPHYIMKDMGEVADFDNQYSKWTIL